MESIALTLESKTRSFNTRKQAEEYAAEIESNIDSIQNLKPNNTVIRYKAVLFSMFKYVIRDVAECGQRLNSHTKRG